LRWPAASELQKLIKARHPDWKDKGQLHIELKKKKIDLDQHDFDVLSPLIWHGDHDQGNYLFDTRIHRWIPFDL
jgi:hypothetical protein